MNRKQMALLLGLSLALGQTAFAADHVAVVEKNGKQGVIDQGGKEILPLAYKKILVGDPKEDPVILVQQKGRYGLYDRDGKQLLAPTLKKITDINEGIIGGVAEKKWNFYTLQGEKLPGEYDEARAFQEGLAAVKLQGKWGFADKTGKVVIQPQYKEVHSFSEGLAAVKKDSQWFYIRKDGTLLPTVSVRKAGDFHQGVAVVDGSWLMDTQGKKYAKLKSYSFVGDFQENGLAEVGVRRASRSLLDYISIGWGWGDGWGWGGPVWGGGIGISPGVVMPSSLYRGYVNKKAQEVISPTYSYVSPFYGKLALIREEGHWGMVDTKGQVVIPAAYDALLPFSEGLAAFGSDKKWGFIDESNKVVIPNRFDSVQSFFQDRTTAVEKDKGGIIDKAGNPVAPFRGELRELGPLTADRAAYRDPEKKKWGYVDENAKTVISPQYDKAGIFD